RRHTRWPRDWSSDVCFPISTTAAMSWFPPRRRATVVGLKQVGLPFGGMLGAAIVPTLALRLGWRLAVAVAALLVVVCAAACAARSEERRVGKEGSGWGEAGR